MTTVRFSSHPKKKKKSIRVIWNKYGQQESTGCTAILTAGNSLQWQYHKKLLKKEDNTIKKSFEVINKGNEEQQNTYNPHIIVQMIHSIEKWQGRWIRRNPN